jgi:UTP:GlnB (protein PII) uridylyltransferase
MASAQEGRAGIVRLGRKQRVGGAVRAAPLDSPYLRLSEDTDVTQAAVDVQQTEVAGEQGALVIVKAPDHPGLLQDLVASLSDAGLVIVSAFAMDV